jgi:hypothetical protein
MTNAARQVGSKFETDITLYLRESGVVAERLARRGSLDEGDIVLGSGEFIAELKARRDAKSSLNLHAWLGEAEREAESYRKARNLPTKPVPILVVKNPNHSIADSFVVLRLKDFIDD